jgi:site-specific recombinase
VLEECSAVHLLAEVGLPGERSFLGEAMDRLWAKVLPRPHELGELASLLAAAFPARRDARWIAELPLDSCLAVAGWIGPRGLAALRRGLADSLRLLAARVAALGLSRELRSRAHARWPSDSPFLALPPGVERWLDGLLDLAGLRALCDACRHELAVVHGELERSGVSVGVVYRLDVVARCLARLEHLAPLARPDGLTEAARLERQRALVAGRIAACIGEESLVELVRGNTRLLARKVIERVGTSGEHYITSSRRQWWLMFASASGGGVLTALTAAGKLMTSAAMLPIFVEAILSSANYITSFLLMQVLGFTLATKQPSMTAAALAAALRGALPSQRFQELVTMVARMTRSQLAAALGNVGWVVPAAFGVDCVFRASSGASLLDPELATRIVASLHVSESPTLWYASLTGVLLWLASLAAGGLENWAACRGIANALAQHRLRRWIGRRRTIWIARKFEQHVAGAGGSVALGALLGFAPVLGKGFGVPIDVRHVTLSAGALTLAGLALGPESLWTLEFAAAIAGVLAIGFLNFGVSFALALAVALRASNLSRAERSALRRGFLVRLFHWPGEFFYPPAGEGEREPGEGAVELASPPARQRAA